MTDQPKDLPNMCLVGCTTHQQLAMLSNGPGSLATMFPVDAVGFNVKLYAVAPVGPDYVPTPEDLIPRSAWLEAQKERDYWRNRVDVLHRYSTKDVWFWQDDGYDNLHSLVNTIPVVIQAETLRNLIDTHADHRQPLQMQLDEADRRAGAAERELAAVREELESLRRVRDKQKKQAGYDMHVSFDVVWSEVLAKAQGTNDDQRNDLPPVPTHAQRCMDCAGAQMDFVHRTAAGELHHCRLCGQECVVSIDDHQSRLMNMTVIDPDQWEPCSPSYLARGGDCATAPRVWHEQQCNHWHPKLPTNSEPVAFAWRQKGSTEDWKVCFDISQAPNPDELVQTEIREMTWCGPILG